MAQKPINFNDKDNFLLALTLASIDTSNTKSGLKRKIDNFMESYWEWFDKPRQEKIALEKKVDDYIKNDT